MPEPYKRPPLKATSPRALKTTLLHGFLLAAGVVAGLTGTLAPAAARAQAKYPSKTITIIVCYVPGGTGDVFARSISDKLGQALGTSVVVENRPGAGGLIGAQMAAKAAPDGHTILMGQTGEMSINKYLMKSSLVDPEKELAPVTLVGKVPLGLAVAGTSPYGNFRALMDAMRANVPGLSFASSGIGTPGHLAAEQLKLVARSSIVHAPYKGAGAALADLLGGHVTYFFSGMPAAIPHVKSGKLRLLAVSTATRAPALPDVPTVAESGQPGFDFSLWGGFFVPTGTPREIVATLNREVGKILAPGAEARERLAADGTEIVPGTPEQLGAFTRSETRKYEQIIRDTGVKSE
jgi:tripartite-type tricarboxylate transporter receptor subunit TctC